MAAPWGKELDKSMLASHSSIEFTGSSAGLLLFFFGRVGVDEGLDRGLEGFLVSATLVLAEVLAILEEEKSWEPLDAVFLANIVVLSTIDARDVNLREKSVLSPNDFL